jgi:ABC-type amino acid transport system permease subunit
MMTMFDTLPPDFVWQVLGGIAVNLHIAVLALIGGFALGIPLALAQTRPGVLARLARTLVALMRAAPTFVVMFFLLNTIPSDVSVLGLHIALSGALIVALSLLPYSAYYIAEAGLDALIQLRRNSPMTALLFLPNVGRAFFVLVMASSTAAAIGVREAIGIIVRQADRMPGRLGQFALFAFGILLFGIIFQVGFALLTLLRRRLAGIAARRVPGKPVAPPEPIGTPVTPQGR